MHSDKDAPLKQATGKEFRTDINGLRAWAVAAVVFYHFGLPGAGGGFVGVDVFFVISGFLMTGIIVDGLEAGRFSVWGFYLARARRIVPALVALCAVLLALGWFMLPAGEYSQLGTHVLSSLLFVSNLKFWLESGYFDAGAHEKWLLHTWSLSVEWQFYLILPLLLWAVWKLRPGRATATWLVAAVLAISLLLNIVLTPSMPSAAFYWLPTRTWEMLAGGMVFLLASRLRIGGSGRRILEALGFTGIITSIVLLDGSVSWPGWRALLPITGTVLVLLAQRTASPWTGTAMAQWLGTRSYSIYLWHWPLVVGLVYLDMQRQPLAVAAGMLLTLVLGHYSYAWVEVPARVRCQRLGRSREAALFATAVLVVAGPALAIRLSDGFGQRLPEAARIAELESRNRNPRLHECLAHGGSESPGCMIGGSRLRAIVLGDSHADAVVNAVAQALPGRRDGVLELTYLRCPTMFGMKYSVPVPSERHCAEFNEWALARMQALPVDVPVVIINRTTSFAVGENEPWESTAYRPLVHFSRPYARPEPEFLREFSAHLVASVCRIAAQRPVYLVRPFPEMGVDVPKVMARAYMHGQHREVSVALADYHARHDFIWAAQDEARERCGARILDPLPHLCRDGRCAGDSHGRPVYYDDDHLSEFGNRLLVPMFSEMFPTH